MKYIAIESKKQRKLPFYLAVEEYVARYLPDGDYFFMWQVEPTVIFGRNQLIDTEVDVEYCREHGIEMYRRKSGGGCVYADKSNIMFSYITAADNVNFTFNRYMLLVEYMLQKLGIDARTTGRNDILIDGKKVSGNAFYHIPGRSIVHGTMLYDTDLEAMARATTPSEEKLKSKGVQSVRQHVTTLNKYITLTIEEFKAFAKNTLTDGTITLGDDALCAIEEIEQHYYTPEFIYGNNPVGTLVRNCRIEGVGEFEVRLQLKNNIIKKVNLLGDFFVVGDIDTLLLGRMCGVEYNAAAVLDALDGINPADVIMNLTKEQLITILF